MSKSQTEPHAPDCKCPDCSTECCPPFRPEPWQDKEFTWKDKLFVKNKLRNIFYRPTNFAQVMAKAMKQITDADAMTKPEDIICMTGEDSLFSSNLYIAVTKEVPDADMVRLSGTYLSKVFEGEFKEMRGWIKQTQEYVKGKGKEVKKWYFHYPTCPKCSEKYGKNYVVIIVKV